MERERKIKFRNESLNRKLVELLTEKKASFRIDESGSIVYPENDEAFVENELVSSVRRGVFPSWQVLSCPDEWVDRYRNYMIDHRVPFEEELADEENLFLIPSSHQPHSWKI
jgi:hypothetical protein